MNVAVLHDEIERLKAELAQTQEALAQSEEARRRLESIVGQLHHEKFGARSEKLSAEQYHLPLEDVEIAQGVLDAAHEKAERIIKGRSDGAGTSQRRNRGHLPAHLPRVEQIIEPKSRLCPCGCGEMARIGEDVSERLDVVPAQLRVLVTRRPKYACRRCSGAVVQAHAPEHVVPGGLPTEALIAQVIVAKFGDHLPFYRQAEIYVRQGIRLDRATLGNWAGRACFHLKPIAEHMRQHLAVADRLFMDETTAPVLDPGRGKVRKGFFWAIASDDRGHGGQGPPIVLFHYAPGRSGEHAERFLQGFRGQFLQVDAYEGYDRRTRLERPQGPWKLAHCWTHWRRRFVKLVHNTKSPIAEAAIQQIAALYAIEATVRGASPQLRLAARRWSLEAPRVTGQVARHVNRPKRAVCGGCFRPTPQTPHRTDGRTWQQKCGFLGEISTETRSRIGNNQRWRHLAAVMDSLTLGLVKPTKCPGACQLMPIKAFPIAVAASVAALTAAHAADLPSRKAPPAAPAVYGPVPYNWTGLYVGLGGAYDRTQSSPSGAVGVRRGTRSRAAFGGYAGYNVQLGPIVYGLEADVAVLSSGSKSNRLAGAANFRERYDGSVRARAGYAIDRWLVYGTGGLAFRDQKVTTPALTAKSKTQTGWLAGVGVERALTDNLIARVEYTHADYGKTKSFAPAGLGRGRSTDDRIMAGLSYKFGM